MADKGAAASSGNVLQDIFKRIQPDRMSGRAVKYPYTLSAKIMNFPYSYYFKNQWIFRYLPVGIILSYPVFGYFQKMSNSPANVEKFKGKF